MAVAQVGGGVFDVRDISARIGLADVVRVDLPRAAAGAVRSGTGRRRAARREVRWT